MTNLARPRPRPHTSSRRSSLRTGRTTLARASDGIVATYLHDLASHARPEQPGATAPPRERPLATGS